MSEGLKEKFADSKGLKEKFADSIRKFNENFDLYERLLELQFRYKQQLKKIKNKKLKKDVISKRKIVQNKLDNLNIYLKALDDEQNYYKNMLLVNLDLKEITGEKNEIC